MKTSDSSTIYNSINGLSESTIHDNTKQDVVIITKDRLKLKLGDFRDSVEDKYRAVTFGGIAITLLIAIVTSSPKDVLGLSADVWFAMFVLSFIFSLVVTICSSIKSVISRKNRNTEEVCRKIMEADDTTNSDI